LEVSFPQDIREACGVEPGTDLMFVKTGPTTFECWVLPPPLSLMGVIEKYSVDGVAPDLDELREEMADDLARAYEPSPGGSESKR
jgi:hypothetical protein